MLQNLIRQFDWSKANIDYKRVADRRRIAGDSPFSLQTCAVDESILRLVIRCRIRLQPDASARGVSRCDTRLASRLMVFDDQCFSLARMIASGEADDGSFHPQGVEVAASSMSIAKVRRRAVRHL